MKRNEAAAIYDKLDPPGQTRDQALVREARTLTKLQAKRVQLRRDLRELQRQIALTKKTMRGLMATDHAPKEWNEQAAPMRVFGEQ